ncbi:hypothetical protein RND71_030225 [Anisodus tanguticus]|uniref:Uncharacterized protein n=1 Tax=Anisodus tanguticus TaxID=243964 RepID=A0AAE1RHS6_9SOLA|nr:hypothetical protein RND71_030225 [Anisodus tanguticus]
MSETIFHRLDRTGFGGTIHPVVDESSLCGGEHQEMRGIHDVLTYHFPRVDISYYFSLTPNLEYSNSPVTKDAILEFDNTGNFLLMDRGAMCGHQTPQKQALRRLSCPKMATLFSTPRVAELFTSIGYSITWPTFNGVTRINIILEVITR